MKTITTFDADLAGIHETREQMRQLRELLELDEADHLAGPAPEQLVRAEERAAPAPARQPGKRWWEEQFAASWPEGKKRRRWMPWGTKR